MLTYSDTKTFTAEELGGLFMIAYIHYLLVALEAQGRGVGSRLLQAALARYRGYTRVVLHTDGAGVQAFYRKHGFSPLDSVCMGLTPKSE